ncbi:hypothetical protein K502DRAFT_237940 [Neoconidiobolus thromboides FSU 785]|nr:hypothetical protein K502DRAFT_237940 [Neoconidiobolus thromboides FSU 785]
MVGKRGRRSTGTPSTRRTRATANSEPLEASQTITSDHTGEGVENVTVELESGSQMDSNTQEASKTPVQANEDEKSALGSGEQMELNQEEVDSNEMVVSSVIKIIEIQEEDIGDNLNKVSVAESEAHSHQVWEHGESTFVYTADNETNKIIVEEASDNLQEEASLLEQVNEEMIPQEEINEIISKLKKDMIGISACLKLYQNKNFENYEAHSYIEKLRRSTDKIVEDYSKVYDQAVKLKKTCDYIKGKYDTLYNKTVTILGSESLNEEKEELISKVKSLEFYKTQLEVEVKKIEPLKNMVEALEKEKEKNRKDIAEK